jgi:hypothetical protein
LGGGVAYGFEQILLEAQYFAARDDSGGIISRW